jgi:hypothetical protein
VDIAVAVPLDIYLIIRNGADIVPYSWSEVHYDFSTIIGIPGSVWLSAPQYVIDVALWRYILPVLGFVTFVLIGLTEDAVGEYMKLGQKVWYSAFGKKPRK